MGKMKRFNTASYFYVATRDNHGHTSARIAADTNAGGGVMIFKAQELVHFGIPWKMKGKTSTPYLAEANETVERIIPAGHCGLIQGYSLICGGGGSPHIDVNGYEFETASGADIVRNPAYTNGMYLEAGDYVEVIATNHPACEAWVRILEFDYDSDISVVVAAIAAASSYTVTSGKSLYVTYLASYEGAPNYLTIYEGGSWVPVWDIESEHWNFGKGLLMFPSGTQLRTDTDSAWLFGVEIKSD